jgi:hypothetical protein
MIGPAKLAGASAHQAVVVTPSDDKELADPPSANHRHRVLAVVRQDAVGDPAVPARALVHEDRLGTVDVEVLGLHARSDRTRAPDSSAR